MSLTDKIKAILGDVDPGVMKRINHKADERLAATIGLARTGHVQANLLVAVMFLKLAEYVNEHEAEAKA